MSLKGLHVFFIAVCILLTLGVGVWGIRDWRETASSSSLYIGIGSFVGCGVLGVYGLWFLKKLRNVGYV
jgi:hypothetical protein